MWHTPIQTTWIYLVVIFFLACRCYTHLWGKFVNFVKISNKFISSFMLWLLHAVQILSLTVFLKGRCPSVDRFKWIYLQLLGASGTLCTELYINSFWEEIVNHGLLASITVFGESPWPCLFSQSQRNLSGTLMISVHGMIYTGTVEHVAHRPW